MPAVDVVGTDGRARAGIVAMSPAEGKGAGAGLRVATPAIVFRTNSGALPYVTPASVDEAIPRLAREVPKAGASQHSATPQGQAILSVDVASVHWVYGSIAGAAPRSEKHKDKATGYGPTAELSQAEAAEVSARDARVGGGFGGLRGFPMLAGWPVMLELDNAVTQTVSVATPEMFKQQQAKERGARSSKGQKKQQQKRKERKREGKGKGEGEKEKGKGEASPVTPQPPATKRRKVEPREDEAGASCPPGDALLIRDGRECVTITPRSMADVAAAAGAALFAIPADLEGLRSRAGRKRRKIAADRTIAWLAEAAAGGAGKGAAAQGTAGCIDDGAAIATVAGLGSPVETMYHCRDVALALAPSSSVGVVLRGVGAALPPVERRALLSACVGMLRGEEEDGAGTGGDEGKGIAAVAAAVVATASARAKIPSNPKLFVLASTQTRDAAMGPAEILSCIAEGCDAVPGDWAEEMTLQGRAAAFVLEGDGGDGGGGGGGGGGGWSGGSSSSTTTTTSSSSSTGADGTSRPLSGRCTISLRDFAYKEDGKPLPGAKQARGCFSRAYVHHLLNTHEMLAQTLLFAHNCSRLLDLVAEARAAVLDERFEEWRGSFLKANSL